ncbi:class II aldolase/adducin family protein [Sulfurospirillum sp. T05]|uniref:Class II aldolase/adducin family protein n=1 Tax=Sulfurospirillum tamanense TaxID=2813362 RepID=A0ABS2WV20_9BACT|nr:class II aldolase/adducin family protein [Sulfurospirillum tamanensis]MBN2965502.1 class II aldolase/adducin family protein [Sulfurospirillum tamanensis]
MKSLWDERTAPSAHDPLALRVYTSNLLGQSDALVLHGGGNTSVKITDNSMPMLYVKGSGWDLVSIQKEGFAPVKLAPLLALAQRESLSDTDMVAAQRAAMSDPSAPNPSVEAILHALIPFAYVDHTHADAVVTISNSQNGEAHIKALYPDFLILPYVMPGFLLAREIYLHTQTLDWSTCKGIILHHHGIFTFGDDAKEAYEKMIDAVSIAEEFLAHHAPLATPVQMPTRTFDVALLCQEVQTRKGHPVEMVLNQSPLALTYASNLALTCKGVLTPEHIIRTKRTPLVLGQGEALKPALEAYEAAYLAYFARYAKEEICLNTAPNYAVIEGFGVVSFGKNAKEAQIIDDIISHTMEAVLRAEALGGYVSIDEAQSFGMEYWELEQAKMRKA